MFRLDDPATGYSVIVSNAGTVAVCSDDGVLFEGWSLDDVKALSSLIDKGVTAAKWIEERAGA